MQTYICNSNVAAFLLLHILMHGSASLWSCFQLHEKSEPVLWTMLLSVTSKCISTLICAPVLPHIFGGKDKPTEIAFKACDNDTLH